MAARAERAPIIAVDAMGGDFGPGLVVPGAVDAVREEGGFTLALYGDEPAIHAALAGLDTADLPITVHACGQAIAMGEPPAAAIRNKPDSSIVRAISDHKAGRVDGFVSAGSTGAVVAASLIILGRLAAVDRPAIASRIPTVTGDCLLLDIGANVQCTPQHLLTFAQMGDVYAREMLGLATPRVALLNNGEEASKGTEATVAAHRLLRASGLNFVGNLEGRGLMQGVADVVVTDGFTGNIALKLIEGMAPFLEGVARHRVSPQEQAVVLPALRILQARLDYADYGGALLLGIAGVSVIAHGASSRRAVRNAVLAGARLAGRDIPGRLSACLAPGA
ncbi:MAG: phosphate acyltransferase PlsX [Candidatus Krumholzibacteriia bacterium]